MNTEELDRIGSQIVDGAMKVHKALGPGLLESAYEACLAHELLSRNLRTQRQSAVPLYYEGIEIDVAYRADLLVEQCVLVEIKAIDQLAAIHTAQLITYLKLMKLHLGFLINFNTQLLKDGIKRIVV